MSASYLNRLPSSTAHGLATELTRDPEPNTPFRAVTQHKHSTWARTFISRPELYLQPESISEVKKIVRLAARCRRRIVVVGSGHSPSDLTCSSSWMVNLDYLKRTLNVDQESKRVRVEAGMRLYQLNDVAAEYGLTIANLGSIDEQSIAGAIATGTHGSSMAHGTLAQSVMSLRIVLGSGECVTASDKENSDLFHAALCSLGALGIIVEVEYQLVSDRRIEWLQTSMPLDDMLRDWSNGLWTQAEFTRIWWLPYSRRVIVWRADETNLPLRAPESNWYGGLVGYHMYKALLGIAHFIPRLLPTIEWFVFGMQYGFNDDMRISAVEQQRSGLLMNCLYSQFVNEWALPLSAGPDIIRAMDAWLHHASLPNHPSVKPAPNGLRVHCPIEVRVADTTRGPRALMDPSCATEPTLYLNATLYRPYGLDPPCHAPYYEAFESVCSALGGRPHWAKNFATVERGDVERMYGTDLKKWRKVRSQSDASGMFVGDWHRRLVMPANAEKGMACEEHMSSVRTQWDGSVDWVGTQTEVGGSGESTPRGPRSVAGSSEESFEVWGREVEESAVLVERGDS
ncbi:L-gulonolactone/D-arabinono-1,4-lactone oxidase [Microthyrium microscopicum]|uniref:D-arabinono-1,4-lactone oxidase n=1 Tax=Microthyrium microscopicum TaxID=703497 RepID=A0A6A6UPS8_9PEZI|nr:L-gulonolactone/D-arabinono-1,4-lactone oxidase [Microthyrium microscopicum]